MTRHRTRTALATVLAAVVAIGAGCATDSTSDDGGRADVGTDTVAATGDGVLDVTAPTVGGGELDLAEFAGTPVALWFWAPT